MKREFLRRNRHKTVLFMLILMLPQIIEAGEWARFRGPDGSGISNSIDLPVKWSERDYLWKLPLPGSGHSSPVVWGNIVFVTSGSVKNRKGCLLAIDASQGTELWRQDIQFKRYHINSLNSYGTNTPAVDKDKVYVLWTTPDESIMVSYNHSGREIWRRTLPGMVTIHGPAASPIIYKQRVIINLEQLEKSPDNSAVFALDSKTGKTIWICPRKKTSAVSYSTPCIYNPATGRAQLILTTELNGFTALDPQNGAVLWEMPGVLPSRVVSSPVVAGNYLLGTCGKGGGGKVLVVIKPPDGGVSPSPRLVYKLAGHLAPYVPTPLVKGDLLFTFHDQGYISCLDKDSGKVYWTEKPAGRFFGSPVWADGKLYAVDTRGEVVVLRATTEYKLLAVNPLGEKSHATPAISGNVIFLRTQSQLIAVGTPTG